jgi:hypothetical protein
MVLKERWNTLLSKTEFDDELRQIFKRYLFERMDDRTKAQLKLDLESYLTSVAGTPYHGVIVKLYLDYHNRKIDAVFIKNSRVIKQSTVLYDHLMTCYWHGSRDMSYGD